ncbi:MAG TPA: hypothetical protein VFQ53_22620 [Kofleriaceae bacterium]|nr:hypothetical protein [Kofleriaceae bacterium]
MAYRDAPLRCPRCQVELVPKSAERWRCPSCRGVAMTSGEVVRGIQAIAPDLRGKPGATPKPPHPTSMRCPACDDRMEQLCAGSLELDRCVRDDLVWFDDWEHIRVFAAAHEPGKHAAVCQLLGGLAR